MWLFSYYTQFSGSSYSLNFNKFCDTAPFSLRKGTEWLVLIIQHSHLKKRFLFGYTKARFVRKRNFPHPLHVHPELGWLEKATNKGMAFFAGKLSQTLWARIAKRVLQRDVWLQRVASRWHQNSFSCFL